MEVSVETEIDNFVFDNDDIIRLRIEEMYDHSRVNLSFLAGLSGDDDSNQFWDYNKLEFEFDYAGEGEERELGLFGDAIRFLEPESSDQSDTSVSIKVAANKSHGLVSKDIPKGIFVDSPPSNAVVADKVRRRHTPAANETPTKSSSPRGTKRTRADDTNDHTTIAQPMDDAVRAASDPRRRRSRSSSLSSPPSSPVPPESPRPRGRGKSKEVMKKYYEPMRKYHMDRLDWAEKHKCEPYTLSYFEGDDDDSDAVSPLRRRARPTPQNRRAINSDDEDIVETPPPKKRARRTLQETPKANVYPLQKKVAIVNDDEDEEMEDETVTSDDDDESWAPNMKERKKNNSKERTRKASTKPPRKISGARIRVPPVPIIGLNNKRQISKKKKKRGKWRKEKNSFRDSTRLPNTHLPPLPPPLPTTTRSIFEQTLENDPRPEQTSKGRWNAAQMAARRALRRQFYAFPEGQQKLNIPPVDQTDLYLDPTDWDSDCSLDDEHEPSFDSIFIKDPKIGPGRSGRIPCLETVTAFIPKDKKPEDPLLLIDFRIRHGLFDKNLETALNSEKECARRWRILEALKEKGFFDNLRIFDVLHPSK